MAAMFGHDVVNEIGNDGFALLFRRQSERQRQNVAGLCRASICVGLGVKEFIVERSFQFVRQVRERALVFGVALAVAFRVVVVVRSRRVAPRDSGDSVVRAEIGYFSAKLPH